MRYESAVAFRTALEARLKAEQSTGVGLSRLRKRVVFERLLARLMTVAPDAWVLRGGFALAAARQPRPQHEGRRPRLAARRRRCRRALLRQAAALELDDYFEFTIGRSAAADDLVAEASAGRSAPFLAGRLFELREGGDDVIDAAGLAAGTIGVLRALGGTSNETQIGHPGNDQLFGEDGDDRLEGRGGDDILDGGPGNNIIIPDNCLDKRGPVLRGRPHSTGGPTTSCAISVARAGGTCGVSR